MLQVVLAAGTAAAPALPAARWLDPDAAREGYDKLPKVPCRRRPSASVIPHPSLT